MKKIYNYLKIVSQWGAYISYIGISVAVLFTVADICMRNLFKKPIVGSYEITQLIFATTVFATFAFTQTEKGHINVTILLRVLPQKIRFIIYTITSILSTVACAAVSWAAFVQMNNVRVSNLITAQHKIPYYPFYAFEGVMMALFTVVLLLDTLQSALAVYSKDYADMIEVNWS